MFNRFCKTALILLSVLAADLTRPPSASAELFVDVRGGNFQPMPIAILEFNGDPQCVQVAGVLTNNLKRSGVFAPLDRARFPEANLGFDTAPNFNAWKAAGVQGVVTGRVTREGARLKAEFRLWDVTSGEQIIGQQYFTDPQAWRRVAHIISDAVYSKVTGDSGFFDTRIVFIDESGPREKRRKRLAIIDQDGANFKALTGGDNLVVTPRYSPNSQDLAYMSFADGSDPKVYVLDVASGRREVVGNFPGMSFSPRFSPDGDKIVMSLQQGGNSNIYVMGLSSKTTTRLTSTAAIDTSPSYSPDGRQIVFESDRGGGQQIYQMGADGSGQKRISFGEGSYSTPVWSPKGDLIAFTKQKGNTFGIGVMKPDGSGERILVEGFHNEGPTWAPNGRYLMFFRDPSGSGGPKLYMVDVNGHIDVQVPTPGYASDPAWSPLLTDLK
jgi:TolB protein